MQRAARAVTDTRQMASFAESPALIEAGRWFSREQAWINDIHLQLCRIPAPTFFEATRAEWFRDQLERLGWRARIDRAGNVLATFTERIAAPALVVSAHLDTVFAPARPEDVGFSPDGGLAGPGVSDNGSGLAAILALARLFAEHSALHSLASRSLLVANVGEEGEGNLSGMRYLCRHVLETSDVSAFVVLDWPSTDHITAQALASRRFEILFSGPGGHSWNDSGIPNPVHALGHLISQFVEYLDARASEHRSRLSHNFGIVEGGSSINAIPTSARAKLDLRSENPTILEELAGTLSASVERSLERANRTAKENRLSARIKELGSRPGGKLADDSFLLRTVQSVDAYLNIRSRIHCASTDANVPLSMGLPAISVGTGGRGGGAHTPSEWYQPEGRDLGLRRILLLLMSMHAALPDQVSTGFAQAEMNPTAPVDAQAMRTSEIHSDLHQAESSQLEARPE